MTTIESLRTTNADPAASIEDLAAASTAAHELAAASEADVGALNSRRPDVLLNGTDKDLSRLDDGIAAAGRTAERAAAIAKALDARVAAARIALEEQGRRARYEAARVAVTDLAVTMPEKYRRLVDLAREMMFDLGQARRLRTAANRDLPEGATELPDPEAFRWKLSRATIVSKESTTLWCHKDGTPLPLQQQGEVRRLDDGHGIIPSTSNSSSDQTRFVRAACWRVTVQPATSLPIVKAFDVGLAIPPLFPGEADGWRQDDRFPAAIEHQLAALQDHEAPRAAAPFEDVIAMDKLDDLKSRHRIV